jgi:hypothetical protein
MRHTYRIIVIPTNCDAAARPARSMRSSPSRRRDAGFTDNDLICRRALFAHRATLSRFTGSALRNDKLLEERRQSGIASPSRYFHLISGALPAVDVQYFAGHERRGFEVQHGADDI